MKLPAPRVRREAAVKLPAPRAHFVRVPAISAVELKEELSARGLGTSGKKAELVGKLREALENPPAAPDAPATSPATTSATTETAMPGTAAAGGRPGTLKAQLAEGRSEGESIQSIIEQQRQQIEQLNRENRLMLEELTRVRSMQQ